MNTKKEEGAAAALSFFWGSVNKYVSGGRSMTSAVKQVKKWHLYDHLWKHRSALNENLILKS